MKTSGMQPNHISPAIGTLARLSARRRVWLMATGAALLVATTGCTTTTQHVSEMRPVIRNSSPGTMGELRIAETALDSGNIELATTLFNKVVQADPKSVSGLTGLGNTLYAVGDFTRAGVYYQRASSFAPTAAEPLIGVARVAIHQRRFDDAISTYRDILSRTPDDPMASAGLGAALDLKGDHAGAQVILRQALKANPGDPLLSVNLGLSLVLGGKPREGANVLLDVTRYPGAPPQARQNLALAYGLLGNTEAAAEILGRDLPRASVKDNLRFYEIQRARVADPVDIRAAQATATAAARLQAVSPR
jgi:Flp pilus assembly protein TadD